MANPQRQARTGDNQIEQCRVDLAAAIRWAVRLGLHEGI